MTADTTMTSSNVPDKNKKRSVKSGGWAAAYKKRTGGGK